VERPRRGNRRRLERSGYRRGASLPPGEKEAFMSQRPKKVCLSRETLRHLDGLHRSGGPVGTEPNSDLPNNCYTASCRPHIC
jgi:hypothetical protein